MRFRNRRNDREEQAPPEQAASGSNGPGSGAGGTQERWGAASRLLAEADAAIDRALSRDSQAFLDSNRQEGGE